MKIEPFEYFDLTPPVSQQIPHQRPINHVAVTVPVDIEHVVSWYNKTVGFQIINQITHIKRSEDPESPIFAIYGDTLKEVKVAYMATGNGTGFELFQFIDPAPQKVATSFEYNRPGFFHVCVTDPQPSVLLDRIIAAGGSQIGSTVGFPALPGHLCLYARDPWGNVLEVLSLGFDRLASAIA